MAASVLLTAAAAGWAQLPSLDELPRPATPPPETGPVVPSKVLRWREEAKAYESGDGQPRDPVKAAELYCRASRYGDAESQFNLAWMLTNARGVQRDEAQAAHLFAAAAEQGFEQAKNILARMGTPQGPPPPCLLQPEDDAVATATPPAPKPSARNAPAQRLPLPLPPGAPPAIVRYVNLVAPQYQLDPALVLAFIATESHFDSQALSPKGAVGLMQLMPDTASRFGVNNARDAVQNLRGGMAYLRWLMATFQGDVTLVAAAYNAGERAVERYLGVPPYAETRLYVLRIRAGFGGRTLHPFDAGVAAPSPVFGLMHRPWLQR